MADKFDPSFAPYMEGEFIGSVKVVDRPNIGFGNLVLNPDEAFDIDVEWRTFGVLNPLWLSALAAGSPNWVVTAYAQPVGPGAAKQLAQVNVAAVSGPLTDSTEYRATLTVPARTLREENPGDPANAGIYRLTVTAFLNSDLGGVGFDIIGFAEGPMIKVENPA